MTADEAELVALRSEFPSLARGVHLISHTLGAMPRAVPQQAARFIHAWEQESYHAFEEAWIPETLTLADTIAGVLGADPGTVVVLPNCSSAISVVASGLRVEGSRCKVVYDDQNFTTMHHIWKQQERNGVRVQVVPSRDPAYLPVDDVLAAIDAQTLIVAVSHVQFRTGAAYDVPRLVERAHEVGALVFLDCYQSAGIVPLALKAWDVDLACGGSVKWACGGPGAGYLYVRPDLISRFTPTATGWLAQAEPFSFELGEPRFAADMWRFASGVPTVVPAYTARPGWELIARVGVERIRRKSLRQTALLRELALARGLTVNTPGEEALRGGLVAIDFPGAAEASRQLLERGFLQDHRPRGGIRLGPHLYTTDDELSVFMTELAAVRERL